MAELCLTRTGHGTVPLGLYRGLWLKGASGGLHPELQTLRGISDMSRRSIPCIISVGLRSDAPVAISTKMQEYGWEPGQYHSVMIVAADPHGQWLDVHDPTNGPEHWPAKDIEYIWDRRALVLTRD